MFSLSNSAIDTQSLHKQLEDRRAGAIVTFEGKVRNHNEGQSVERLEYEAYEELCLSEGQTILREALSKYEVHTALTVHRTGVMEIGEVAVWVGVCSSHRAEAFEAARYIIDEIKARLPIWKKEHYVDGQAVWVNCQHVDRATHAVGCSTERGRPARPDRNAELGVKP